MTTRFPYCKRNYISRDEREGFFLMAHCSYLLSRLESVSPLTVKKGPCLCLDSALPSPAELPPSHANIQHCPRQSAMVKPHILVKRNTNPQRVVINRDGVSRFFLRRADIDPHAYRIFLNWRMPSAAHIRRLTPPRSVSISGRENDAEPPFCDAAPEHLPISISETGVNAGL